MRSSAGASAWSACWYLFEPLTALGLGAASSELDSFLLSCKSYGILVFCIDVGVFRFVRGDLWSGSVCGKAFLSLLHH